MQLILISGLSGSGKSVALRMLEDSGFYCIDNLPTPLLPDAVARCRAIHAEKLAISIDTRGGPNLNDLPEALRRLSADGLDVRLLFLGAKTDTLVRRFSETRRRHPLDGDGRTLEECIALERELLADIKLLGHRVDTSELSANQLRHWIRQFVTADSNQLTVVLQSFGFKHSVPLDADLVFDVRCLPNPHYDLALRPLTGLDQPVIDFLAAEPEVAEMLEDIYRFVNRWLPSYAKENRSYLTVAIGCTGGQHRSVYIASQLAKRLHGPQLLVRHRQLDALP